MLQVDEHLRCVGSNLSAEPVCWRQFSGLGIRGHFSSVLTGIFAYIFQLLSQSWKNNVDWMNLKYFPRVAFCEFRRDFLGHDYGNGIPYEVRCTIGINMLNEKVRFCHIENFG